MIYFEQDNNRITKYKVRFDVYKLQKLREKIIDRCSLITAERGQTFSPETNKFKFTERRDVISEAIIEDGVDYSEFPIVYNITYREYEYPNLALYIEGIIDQKPTYLRYILSKERINEETMYKARIKSLFKEINETEEEDMREIYLKGLKKTLDNASLNEGQEPEMNYYEELMSLIKMEKIDSIDLPDVERVCEFLDIDKNKLSKKMNTKGTNNN